MEDLHSKIEEADIYRGKDGDDRSYGLEDESHVTLLYGLHDDEVDPEDVMKICTSEKYPDCKLHNVSLFENNDYDVLKFDVDCDLNEEGRGRSQMILHKINKQLTKLPHSTKFPDYHPHATIAYLKPGTGKKYVKLFNEAEFTAPADKIVYSRPDGEKIEKKVDRYIDQNKEISR
jgi:2'-5' RNA ligase